MIYTHEGILSNTPYRRRKLKNYIKKKYNFFAVFYVRLSLFCGTYALFFIVFTLSGIYKYYHKLLICLYFLFYITYHSS